MEAEVEALNSLGFSHGQMRQFWLTGPHDWAPVFARLREALIEWRS